MRLLFIAFELDENSHVLAWQGRVANALAAHCEQVIAVADHVGQFSPRENVEVHALPGRPWGVPRKLGSTVLLNPWFYRLCRREHIDACFIHMASRWGYRLAPTWRALHLPVLLWYAHGSVSRGLRVAVRCVDRVVTSSPEGFRLPSDKRHIIGQGIDTELFTCTRPEGRINNEIVYCGRIAPRKRIELMIDVVAQLRQRHDLPVVLRLIGRPATPADEQYATGLRRRVEREQLADVVRFDGFRPLHEMPPVYRTAFLHLNVSNTGSMDKTVLESLACGCPVLTSNVAFRDFLSREGYPQLFLETEGPVQIAEQVAALYRAQKRYAPAALRSLIVGKHDLASYAQRVMHHLHAICPPMPVTAEGTT